MPQDVEAMVRELREERDALRRQNEIGRTEFATIQTELGDARAKIAMLEHEISQLRLGLQERMAERDHFMRQMVEMMANVSSAASILLEAANKTALGAYRPNGHAPIEQINEALDKVRKAVEVEMDAIPSFLRQDQ